MTASLSLENVSLANLQRDKAAVLFLIHGTRNPQAVDIIRRDMDRMCGQYAQQIEMAHEWVQYCFLEFLEPSLTCALEKACEAGRTQLFIVPLLLFPGTHLYNDVPEATEEITAKYPNVSVHVGDAIGVLEPEFADILTKRLLQSMG